MHNAYKFSALSSAVIAALTFASPLMAAEGDAQEEKQAVEQVADQAGEEVVVRDTRAEAMTAFQQLTRQDIANRPTGDGNLVDLLRSNPNVQFSNSSMNGMQMGDIRPSDISIHGSLAYQNNFMIDGISANSDLDPAAQSSMTMTRLASSDEQGFYVDPRLIESVTVYDSNVPVEFGGFSGGVIDSQTRSWSGENHFSVFARATEAGWNETIVDSKLNFDSGNSDISHPGQFQTDYEKRTYGFTGEFGFSDNMGIVVGYTHRSSKIPQLSVGGVRTTITPPNPKEPRPMPGITQENVEKSVDETKQVSDNLFVKSSMYLTDVTQLDVSLNYSGFKSEGFLPTAVDSGFENKHDAYNITTNLKHRFENALWETSLGYTHMVDEMNSDSETFINNEVWDPTAGTVNQMRSEVTGGYGDLESIQDVFTGKTKLEFDPIQYQNTSHQFSVGADFSITDAEYKRDKNFYMYSMYSGQQIAQTHRFKKGSYTDSFQQYGVFAQHLMEAGDWTFRTGIRGEYDDFTEDFNFAPRFTASWDVWGNNSTIATFGANRYYGRNILAYALYGAQNGGKEMVYYEYADDQTPPKDAWISTSDYDGLTDLETPYDDELTVGLTQRLPADWLANLTYVHRKGKKGVRSWEEGTFDPNMMENSLRRHFDNSGKTEHDSVTLAFSNVKPMHFLGADNSIRFSAAWQETKSNLNHIGGYGTPDVHGVGSFDSSKVILDGKLVDADKLDTTDFNIPLRLMLETTHTWNKYGVTWFNFFRWDGSRDQAMQKSESVTVNGVSYREFETVDFDSVWAWDTKVQYCPDWARGLEVALEVTNLINNENVSDAFIYKGLRYETFEPGRQVWLQMSYNY